jgi:hypothetical protein
MSEDEALLDSGCGALNSYVLGRVSAIPNTADEPPLAKATNQPTGKNVIGKNNRRISTKPVPALIASPEKSTRPSSSLPVSSIPLVARELWKIGTGDHLE